MVYTGSTPKDTNYVARVPYFGCEVELGIRCRPYLGGTLRRGGILLGEMQPIPLKRAATLVFILEVHFHIFFC